MRYNRISADCHLGADHVAEALSYRSAFDAGDLARAG